MAVETLLYPKTALTVSTEEEPELNAASSKASIK